MFEFCSGLVDLVVCVGRHGGGRHRFTLAGERFVGHLAEDLAHLREVLGDQTYESLARKGETMTTAAMATFAYDQIDQARTELEHPS